MIVRKDPQNRPHTHRPHRSIAYHRDSRLSDTRCHQAGYKVRIESVAPADRQGVHFTCTENIKKWGYNEKVNCPNHSALSAHRASRFRAHTTRGSRNGFAVYGAYYYDEC